jgi:hypothetical protein
VITFTDPTVRTEVRHGASARVISGAPLYPAHTVDDTTVYVKPHTVTASYDCRTQLGHDSWVLAAFEIIGTWVDAGDLPHPAYTATPRAALLLTVDTAPDWALAFAHAHVPHQVRFILPGHTNPIPLHPALRIAADHATAATAGEHPTTPVDISPVDNGPVVIGTVTTSTEAHHTVHVRYATGADPLRIPAHDPGHRDRWMRPEQVTVTYRQRTGPYTPAGWMVGDVSVTGPWVTEDNQLDPHALGNAHWPRGEAFPRWLLRFVTDHIPAPGSGLTLAIAVATGEFDSGDTAGLHPQLVHHPSAPHTLTGRPQPHQAATAETTPNAVITSLRADC